MLFRKCLIAAGEMNSLDELRQFAVSENAKLRPPLDDTQALQKAEQVWKYKLEGRLFVPGGEPGVLMRRSDIERLCRFPIAFTLLAILRGVHENKSDPEFAAAVRPLSEMLSTSPTKITDALNTLISLRYLERTYAGGRYPGDPSLYRLMPRTI
jgi:hypothetical protein